MNIYLIRHGDKMDDNKNHELLELTEKGIHQADLLGKRLVKYNIQKIYSSSMKRTIQTSELLNKCLGVEIIVKTELREIHMGASETEGWDYFEKYYPDFIREFNKHEKDLKYPPNGECGNDVWVRVSKIIDEITSSDLENIAIVTHGGVIRVLICGLLQLDQARRFFFGSPPENCSISLIKYDKATSQFNLHRFNDYSHLEETDEKLFE